MYKKHTAVAAKFEAEAKVKDTIVAQADILLYFGQ